MVAYSFRPRFAEPILAGTKDQTIRAPRAGRGHVRPGEALQLYTGMRTRQCRLILRTTCLAVLPVQLFWRPAIAFVVDGAPVPLDDLDAFARRDGFTDADDMAAFWRAEHPALDVFEGTLIRWQPPTQEPPR